MKNKMLVMSIHNTKRVRETLTAATRQPNKVDLTDRFCSTVQINKTAYMRGVTCINEALEKNFFQLKLYIYIFFFSLFSPRIITLGNLIRSVSV